MEEMIEKIMSTVGLDKETAEKVADFIKEYADDIPGWIATAGLKDKLPGELGNLL